MLTHHEGDRDSKNQQLMNVLSIGQPWLSEFGVHENVHGDSSWSGVRCDRNILALLFADSMCIWISLESNAGAVVQLR